MIFQRGRAQPPSRLLLTIINHILSIPMFFSIFRGDSKHPNNFCHPILFSHPLDGLSCAVLDVVEMENCHKIVTVIYLNRDLIWVNGT